VQISLMALMLAVRKKKKKKDGACQRWSAVFLEKKGERLPHGHGLGRAVIRDKVVGNGAHCWLNNLRRDINVAGLRSDGQDLGDVLLVGLVVLL